MGLGGASAALASSAGQRFGHVQGIFGSAGLLCCLVETRSASKAKRNAWSFLFLFLQGRWRNRAPQGWGIPHLQEKLPLCSCQAFVLIRVWDCHRWLS